MTPPFRADHVGSLIRPARLMDAFQRWEAGKISTEELRALPDKYVKNAVALQEEVGLQGITDGEFRRRSWQRGFIDAVGGIGIKASGLHFRDASGPVKALPAMFIEAKLRRSGGIVTEDFQALRALTDRTPKITLPAPSALHVGLFSKFADPAIYPDIEEVFDDLVAIYREEIAELGALGCTYLQIDEVGLAALCDPYNRDYLQAQGEDPNAIVDLYFELNSRILEGRPEGMTVCMHLCRGNQAGLWMAEGGYEPIAERLFNLPNIDGYFLEYDSSRAGDFAPLRHLPTGKMAMIGIVSTKTPEVESLDYLRRRVDEAAIHCDLDHIGVCPQCGFASSISSWNVTRNPMTEDIEKQKLARLVEAADRIWGA